MDGCRNMDGWKDPFIGTTARRLDEEERRFGPALLLIFEPDRKESSFIRPSVDLVHQPAPAPLIVSYDSYRMAMAMALVARDLADALDWFSVQLSTPCVEIDDHVLNYICIVIVHTPFHHFSLR